MLALLACSCPFMTDCWRRPRIIIVPLSDADVPKQVMNTEMELWTILLCHGLLLFLY